MPARGSNGRDHSGGPKLAIADDWREDTEPEAPARVTNAAVLKAVGKLTIAVGNLEKRLGEGAAAVAKWLKWMLAGLGALGLLVALLWWLR